MNKQISKSADSYLNPTCHVIGYMPEGVLCESSEDDSREGGNETYNAWQSYENSGWY